MTDKRIAEITDAIRHAEEVAADETKCTACRDDHRQLASWLQELCEARTQLTVKDAEKEKWRKECGRPGMRGKHEQG